MEDFKISGPANPVVVAAGQAAQFSIGVAPATASGFPNQVTLTASDLPANSTASFNQDPVNPGSNTTVTLTVNTTGRGMVPMMPKRPFGPLGVQILFAVMAMGLAWTTLVAFRHGYRTGWWIAALPLALLLVSLAVLSGCAAAQGTPAGTSQITVTATSGNLTHTTTVTLAVN